MQRKIASQLAETGEVNVLVEGKTSDSNGTMAETKPERINEPKYNPFTQQELPACKAKFDEIALCSIAGRKHTCGRGSPGQDREHCTCMHRTGLGGDRHLRS